MSLRKKRKKLYFAGAIIDLDLWMQIVVVLTVVFSLFDLLY